MTAASSCTTPSAFGRPPNPTLVSSGSSSTMLTPAMSASSTSLPCIICSNAVSTHVRVPSLVYRCPMADATTTGRARFCALVSAMSLPASLLQVRPYCYPPGHEALDFGHRVHAGPHVGGADRRQLAITDWLRRGVPQRIHVAQPGSVPHRQLDLRHRRARNARTLTSLHVLPRDALRRSVEDDQQRHDLRARFRRARPQLHRRDRRGAFGRA